MVEHPEIEEERKAIDFPEKIDEEDLKLWLKELRLAGYDITFHWKMPKVFQGAVKDQEFVSRKFSDMHGGSKVSIWKKTAAAHYLLWKYKWAGGEWWMRTKP